jgi:hypothetical protein
MMRLFSKTMLAAYPVEDLDLYLAAGTLPDDLVEVTDEAWAEIMAAEGAGKVISSDANGYPIAIDAPPRPTADLKTRALALLPGWEQAERAAGIDHAGRRWLTTPEALQDIRDVLLADTVPGEIWIDAARQPVPMTLPDLKMLWGAIVAAGMAIYQRRLAMEAEIAAMDAEQLTAFEPAWPA